MKELKNILLVSGSGRNCGKTTVVCHLISQLTGKYKVYGLKITPHFHLTGKSQQLVFEGKGYKIFKENDSYSNKDSSRMLKAGADEVYFIQCVDVNLQKAYKHLKKLIPENCPVVCESGSFANVYQPGFHILVKGITVDETKVSYRSNVKRADVILAYDEFSITDFDQTIEFKEMNWTLNRIKHDQVRRSA